MRIVRVPPAVHEGLPQAAKDGFPQFYAKNVGLRRARGQFVLVTNGDVLLGQVLRRGGGLGLGVGGWGVGFGLTPGDVLPRSCRARAAEGEG